MNLLIICKFSLALVIVQVSASTLTTYIFIDTNINTQPMWLFIQYGLYIFVSAIVFVLFARANQNRFYLKAFLIALIAELFGILVLAVIVDDFFNLFTTVLNLLAISIAIFLGTTLGRWNA